jgi:hypothetical protein
MQLESNTNLAVEYNMVVQQANKYALLNDKNEWINSWMYFQISYETDA